MMILRPMMTKTLPRGKGSRNRRRKSWAGIHRKVSEKNHCVAIIMILIAGVQLAAADVCGCTAELIKI